ncbi:MAG: T9SS type A sorting domain-containing protein [Haliscomenobacter sp.]|nr:T9SS type A sorting domain-containing protein [Haliscomenobacter sp.]
MRSSLRTSALLTMACFLFVTGLQAQHLVKSTFLRTYAKTEIGVFVPIPGFVKYDVDVYKLEYATPNVQGKPDTASGLLAVPVVKNLSFPLLVYQHGTAGSREAVPSRLSFEATIGLVGGALGYVSVLPDYLGLGDSDGFHPYLHAKTEASAAVDMLRAARQFAASATIALNGQVFVSGYSQGGHAAMALHRELETNLSAEFKVTASAPMSGPYSISGDMKSRLLSEEEYFYPGYPLYTMLSYNLAYGVYDSLAQFIRAPYLSIAQAFYSGEETRIDSIHARLARALILEKGKVVPKYIFPDTLLAAIASNPAHPVNAALSDNDVYKWAPKAPTRLFYCRADDQVVYTNSTLADSVMRSLGSVDIQSADLNPNFDHGQCIQPALLSTILFFSFYQTTPTGTEDGLPELPVYMYPNPASGSFTLEGLPPQSRVHLTDLSGRLLRRIPAGEGAQAISLSGLNRGMYLVRVLSSAGVWTGKLVVE